MGLTEASMSIKIIFYYIFVFLRDFNEYDEVDANLERIIIEE